MSHCAGFQAKPIPLMQLWNLIHLLRNWRKWDALINYMHLTTQYCLPYGGRHFASISDLVHLVDALCDSRLSILSHPKITVSKLSFLWIRIPSYIAGKSASCDEEATGPYQPLQKAESASQHYRHIDLVGEPTDDYIINDYIEDIYSPSLEKEDEV